MSIGNNSHGPQVNTTRGQQFIPEQWLNEVQAFRMSRQLDDSCIKTFGAEVKKGDTFHIPRISELGVEDKASDMPVNIQSNADTDYVLQIDTDRVTAVGIDELLELESSYDIRAPHLMAMGYALAKDFTGSILGLRAAINNNVNQVIYSSSNGLLTGNGLPFSFTAFLTARTMLLDADVPEEGLVLLVSPRQEMAFYTIPQFISVDYVNDKIIAKGQIGVLMGVKIVRTSMVKANSLTGWKNGAYAVGEPTPGVTGSRYLPKQNAWTSLPLTFGGNAAPVHTAIMMHKEWACGVVTKRPKVTQSFENAYQMHLMVSRQAYGTKVYRDDHAVLIHTSAA